MSQQGEACGEEDRGREVAGKRGVSRGRKTKWREGQKGENSGRGSSQAEEESRRALEKGD